MNRYMHVVYCDDVRQEVNGKTSLIGVYGADLFVTELPVTLPKLAIVVTIVTDASEPFQSLTVTLLRGDAIVSEIKVPSVDLEKAIQVSQLPMLSGELSSVVGPRLYAFGATLLMAPFPIETPTVLRVVAKTESGELRGPALRMGLLPNAKPPSNAAPIAAENSVH